MSNIDILLNLFLFKIIFLAFLTDWASYLPSYAKNIPCQIRENVCIFAKAHFGSWPQRSHAMHHERITIKKHSSLCRTMKKRSEHKNILFHHRHEWELCVYMYLVHLEMCYCSLTIKDTKKRCLYETLNMVGIINLDQDK